MTSNEKKQVVCPACEANHIVRRMPKEIDRRLDHEQITIPGDPEPETRTIAILRVTYEREFLCTSCGYQWWETHIIERQQSA